jgi:hypothetical protein
MADLTVSLECLDVLTGPAVFEHLERQHFNPTKQSFETRARGVTN